MARANALAKAAPPGASELMLASVSREVPQLDRLIHERLRLGIVSALAASPSLTFTEMKKLLSTTDGNLSVHARKLEEAGYVDCEKTFRGRVPQSVYRLTDKGRTALEQYLNHMAALVTAMKGNSHE